MNDSVVSRRRQTPNRSGRKGGRAKLNAIYNILRNRICFFEIPPGSILRESELARQFQTSRTPIRQILQRLEIEGLVEVRDGVGNLVTPVDYSALSDVYRLRLRVAELVGDFTPRQPSADAVKQISILLASANLLRSGKDLRQFWRIENDRHIFINEMISNAPLRALHDNLYFQTARVWYGVVDKMWPEAVDGLCRELELIKNCVEVSDIRGMGYVNRNMIAEGMFRLKRHFARNK
ncbi:GntR family transcriptional regulator [Mesorhizobium sp. M1312]|uniref:GntR family transcriptional regulator n=1 Tax=unclassified Mesorhizobium TaxID=325217 RepID=UPI00333DC9C7